MKDKRLILKLKKKDPKALDALIKEYSPYVFTIIRNISDEAFTDEDVEELSADVFFRLWQNAEKLDEERSVSPYLAACARNCAVNRLRKTNPEYYLGDELMSSLISRDSVEEDYETTEQIELISDCLDELSKENKEIFIRFYFYGEKLGDLSKKIGSSENACKTRLFRVRTRLKSYLAERGYGDEKE